MNKHFYLDGYSISTKRLSDVDNMTSLLEDINKKIYKNKGKLVLIPYFNGKIHEDGGVSGIILADNSHFTCHTFCYRNAMFVDYYGNINNHQLVKDLVLKTYPTNDIDLCKENSGLKGNFGKHIIVKSSNLLSFSESKDLINKILIDIDMTPINKVITNYKTETEFDLIQPIAESHISIHRNNNCFVIDTFSCKYFDEQKLLKILKENKYDSISRGIRYK